MDTEATTRALRALGTEERHTPSRVDVNTIIRTGQRRLNVRHTVTGLAVAAAVIAAVAVVPIARQVTRPATPATPTPLTCAETVLPMPTGWQINVMNAGDPTGRYLATQLYDAKGDHSLGALWTGGLLSTFAFSGRSVEVQDVSSSGTVVYDASPTSGGAHFGYIYHDGTTTKLTGVADILPRAINGKDEIVGVHNISSYLSTPVVWRSPTTGPEALSLPSGYPTGQAIDVDEDGTILGTVTHALIPFEGRVVLWLPNGRLRMLPLPTQVRGATAMTALSIRDGVVTVIAAVPGPRERDVVLTYRVATGKYSIVPNSTMYDAGVDSDTTVTETLQQIESPKLTNINFKPGEANGRGWFIGHSGRPTGVVFTPTSGFVILPSLMDPIPTNIAGGPGAYTISNDGRVIGGTDYRDPRTVPVTWTCH